MAGHKQGDLSQTIRSFRGNSHAESVFSEDHTFRQQG